MKLKLVLTVVMFVGIVLLYGSVYVVDETQQVVITQFGRIVGEPVQEPGLHFKLPFIQKTNFYPRILLHWDGDPGQIPTQDKTYIWVDTFARWKIVDPVKFLETAQFLQNAYRRLDDIIDPAVRNFVTSNRLIEAVRKSDRPLELINPDLQKTQKKFNVVLGRQKLTQGILRQAQPKLDKFGIELVDVKIKRINYVDTVRDSVYDRMIAERKQIAEKFRSEGKGEAQKIIGKKERDLKEILSGAYKTAQEVKGKADAETTRIYAEAFSTDPEFYSFIKTLEIYQESLGENASLILTTDSEFFKYFKGYSGKREASSPLEAKAP